MFPYLELHVIDGAEQSASDETKEGLTGIIGSKNESINIPAEILQDINSTGMYVCMHISLFVHVYISASLLEIVHTCVSMEC